MNTKEIIDTERGERSYYLVANWDEEILLPLTRDGFEAMLERTVTGLDLPVDDAMRSVLAGYVHHIPNNENTTSFPKLSKVLWKAVSNSTTWQIDQEVKLNRQRDLKIAHEAELAKNNEQGSPVEDQVFSIVKDPAE